MIHKKIVYMFYAIIRICHCIFSVSFRFPFRSVPFRFPFRVLVTPERGAGAILHFPPSLSLPMNYIVTNMYVKDELG